MASLANLIQPRSPTQRRLALTRREPLVPIHGRLRQGIRYRRCDTFVPIPFCVLRLFWYVPQYLGGPRVIPGEWVRTSCFSVTRVTYPLMDFPVTARTNVSSTSRQGRRLVGQMRRWSSPNSPDLATPIAHDKINYMPQIESGTRDVFRVSFDQRSPLHHKQALLFSPMSRQPRC